MEQDGGLHVRGESQHGVGMSFSNKLVLSMRLEFGHCKQIPGDTSF
jgi:hypothetical protein